MMGQRFIAVSLTAIPVLIERYIMSESSAEDGRGSRTIPDCF